MTDLWDFAVRLYGQRGVAPACLALQDRCGLDVNQLMFAAWAGFEHGVALAPPDFAAAAQHVHSWREHVVVPLRQVRRRMKDGALSSFHPDSAQLREEVKALELRAEQLQLQALEAWAQGRFRHGIVRPDVDAACRNVTGLLQGHGMPAAAAEPEPAALAALHEGIRQLAAGRGRS